MANRKEIRNSTAEFLIFQIEGKEQGVEVFYKDKTVWCTQKAMGMLFDVNIPAISKHLKNIYEQGELTEERTVSKMEIVRMEGNRQVKRETVFFKRQAKCLPNKQKNMLKRSLKNIVSYKTAYSKVTSIGLWTLFLLRKILKNKIHDHLSDVIQ